MRTSWILYLLLLLLVWSHTSAQWLQTNGPYGAQVTCFATSGSDIFAGTFGVFLSTDNGIGWKAVNAGLRLPQYGGSAWHNGDVTALAFCGTNLLAGFDNGDIFLSSNKGQN